MVTEDYVSFEVTKLLKEKGFDEPCYAYWHESEKRLIISQSMHAIQNITNPCFFGPAAPTLQMAMKWLREIHNLNIEIFVIKNYDKKICEYTYTIMDLNFPGSDDGIDCCNKYKTYEQACEAAIKYCLEHLI